MTTYEVEVEFTEPMLGTVPVDNKALEFIAPKDLEVAHLEEERATAPEPELDENGQPVVEVKGRTSFHMVEGRPILYDYMLKGFFKDACSMLRRDGGAKEGTLSSKLTAFKKVIDGCVFVKPRQIPIEVADNKLLVVKRPLRVDTPKGSRVAIATSEAVPAGSRIAFRMIVGRRERQSHHDAGARRRRDLKAGVVFVEV